MIGRGGGRGRGGDFGDLILPSLHEGLSDTRMSGREWKELMNKWVNLPRV